jgi:hypothetical protein
MPITFLSSYPLRLLLEGKALAGELQPRMHSDVPTLPGQCASPSFIPSLAFLEYVCGLSLSRAYLYLYLYLRPIDILFLAYRFMISALSLPLHCEAMVERLEKDCRTIAER